MQPGALNIMVRALNAARIISALPKALFTAGSKTLPDKLSEEQICEWVAVSRNGTRLASQAIEGRGYYRMTAAATLIFAEALSRHANRETGVRSIDELLTVSEILPALERRGIAVRKQASTAPEG